MIILVVIMLAIVIPIAVVLVDTYNKCPKCKKAYRGKIISTTCCDDGYVMETYKCKKCGHTWTERRSEPRPPGDYGVRSRLRDIEDRLKDVEERIKKV